MSGVSNFITNIFTNLALSFPDYIFISNSRENEDEALLNESESEGKKFSNHFVEKYGENGSYFLDSSLSDAITVSTVEGKPLLIYLDSPYHDNSSKFNSLLARSDVSEALKEGFICWGCDATSHYGYSLLSEFSFPISELPILLVLFKQDENSSLMLLGTIGYKDGETLLSSIEGYVHQALGRLAQAQLEREYQEESRRLVEEQRREYEAAVEADRQILAQTSLSESAVEEVEEVESDEEETKAHEKEIKMEKIRENIPEEPKTGDIIRVRVVFPNGAKMQRNFLVTDQLKLLLQMVELDIYDNNMDIEQFELYIPIPKLVVDESSCEQTFEELKLNGSIVFRMRVLYSVC